MDQDQDNRRGEARVAVAGEAVMRKGYVRHAVGLCELSPGGCRTEIAERVEHGERLFVTLPGLAPMEARVRWEDGWMAGLKFDRPMHPAVVDHLARTIR